MPRLSRQRGQGATEYILILALALIFILGLLFVFRNSIGGATQKMTAAVSGKGAEKSVTTAATAQTSGSSESADGSASGSDGAAGAEKGAPAEGSGSDPSAQGNDGSGESDSSGEAAENPPGEEKGRVVSQQSSETGNQARGSNFKGRGMRNVTLWILIGIAGFLVLVVLYFLSASR